MRRNLIKAVREVWRAFGNAFDPYRPERHYMRGPGPKCHAKRVAETAVATPSTSADFSTLHG